MLPRSKSKCVTIGPDRYRYIIAEAMPIVGDALPLTITIQHDSANGAVLRVMGLTVKRVPVEESKWYDGRTIASPITPRQIVDLISRAKHAGWVPDNPGPPFAMTVEDGEVRESDDSA